MITRVLGQQSCHVIDCKYIVANVIKSSREKSNNPARQQNPTKKTQENKVNTSDNAIKCLHISIEWINGGCD